MFKKLKLFIVLFVSTLPLNLFAQQQQNDTINVQAVKIYIRVWGFLKYFSPAKTTNNWDSLFLSQIPDYYGIQSEEDLNRSIITFLNRQGNVAGYPKHPPRL